MVNKIIFAQIKWYAIRSRFEDIDFLALQLQKTIYEMPNSYININFDKLRANMMSEWGYGIWFFLKMWFLIFHQNLGQFCRQNSTKNLFSNKKENISCILFLISGYYSTGSKGPPRSLFYTVTNFGSETFKKFKKSGFPLNPWLNGENRKNENLK